MKNLTQKEVFEAIERYKEKTEGEPNCQELLKFLGRGSMGTVHKYLTAYRSSNKCTYKTRNGEAEIKLPSALGEAWASEVGRLQDVMNGELQAIRDANDKTIREQEMELDMLRMEIDRQALEIETKDDQITELKTLLRNFTEIEQHSGNLRKVSKE